MTRAEIAAESSSLVSKTPETPSLDQEPVGQPYDKRKLSYANTFTNPYKATVIRILEWLTGKLRLLRLIRKFERQGVIHGHGFFRQALDIMQIPLETPADQIANIPATGPVIIVANHPHGLVDGMILADLIGRVREDYKILTRSILTSVDEITEFMIPVPFPHEEDAQRKSIQMRKKSMAHLAQGGVIVIFPSGVVATSATMFGDVIENEWNPFTAKMIQRSNATVVPVYFPGQNSRWYQIANQLSATLRQGLLIYEVVHAMGKPQAPVVGKPVSEDKIHEWSNNPRGFVAWLREITLALGDK